MTPKEHGDTPLNTEEELDKILGSLVWVAQMAANRIENNIGNKQDNIERTKVELKSASQLIQALLDTRVREARVDELEFVKRIELEVDANICDCGEKWSETDIADLIKDRINQLKVDGGKTK